MAWYRLSVVILAGTLLMAIGCGGGGGGSTTTQAVTQAPTALAYPINPGNYTKGLAIIPNAPTIGGGAVTAFSVSPALPAGLNLNTVNGLISGTPTVAMPSANYVVMASNAGGSTTTTLTITVIDSAILPPTGLVYSTNPAFYIQGIGITPNMPTVSGGGASSFKVSPSLPGGLVLNPVSGVISGTPTTASASAAYAVTASNPGGSITAALIISVTAPPTISSFNASPGSIALGQSSTLSWSVSGATSLSISPNIGAVTGGSLTVTPTTTTSYTLTATNAAGSVSAMVIVNVTAPPLAPIIGSFTATPSSITAGQSSLLSWSVSGATSLSISPNVGVVTGSNLAVAPNTTTSYTLTATNAAGSVRSTVTVSVTTSPFGPTIANFTATPSSITVGQSSNLSWSVSGATSLSISPGIGAVTGNSLTVSPTTTTTYTLTASNSNGSLTASTSITVTGIQAAPVISSFTASPSTLTAGQSSILSWSVSGATSLSLSPNIGAVTGSSLVVTPNTTTSYTLTAINGTGTTTATVTINLTGLGAPVISGFTASPLTITAGQSSTLSWAVSGAGNIIISPAIGIVTGSSLVVTPTQTTTYTLTATNTAGANFATITITVSGTLPGPSISSFTATKNLITSGASITLTAVFSGGTGIVDKGIGQITSGTPVAIAPTSSTTYTLTVTGNGGTVTANTTVTVVAPPVISSFTAAQSSINPGSSTTLNATFLGSGLITPGIGAVTSGIPVSTGVLNTNTTFTLTVTNAAGLSISETLTVQTAGSLPSISSFQANPSSIAVGQNSILTWVVTGATSLSISPGVGAVTGTSVSVTPNSTTTYTLLALNAAGSSTSKITITVTASPVAPTISSFNADSPSITYGQSSTVTWAVSGATSLSISPTVGSVTGTSAIVTPREGTTYTLTATNSAGSATSLVTIAVTRASVYVLGNVDNPNGDPGYWQNGVYTHLDPTFSHGVAGAIVLSSGDLYVSGGSGYWKNGSWVGFNQPSESHKISIGSLAVSGSDVYAVGSITNSSQQTIYGYWLNGGWSPLAEDFPGGLVANNGGSLIVADGDIYIRGKSGYWKNGTWIPLFVASPASFSNVNSVEVSGGNVYASGYSTQSNDYPIISPCYWINGSLVELAIPQLDMLGGLANTVVAAVPCMALSGNDIYVGGNLSVAATAVSGSTLVPGYWLNGKWVTLPLPSGSSGGLVTSIRILGADVYVGGGLNPVSPTTVGIPGYWLNGSWVPQALPTDSSTGSVISMFIQ